MNLRFTGLAACCIVAFTACDKSIPNPNQASTPTTTPSSLPTVLLECGTGFYCPQTVSEQPFVDSMMALYPGQIIPVSLHVGYFATPNGTFQNSPPGSFTTDLRTVPGNQYDSLLGLGQSLPSYAANRAGATQGQAAMQDPACAASIASQLAQPAALGLQLSHTYNSSTHQLDVTVNGNFLTTTSGQFRLAVLMVEDSVYDWQALVTGASLYMHRNVLRGSIHNPSTGWGDVVATGTQVNGSTFTQSYTGYTVNSNWNAAHCRIVAYVYENTTKTVLQAIELPL